MTLFSKVKKFAKTALMSGAILSAFIFGGHKANAQSIDDKILNPPKIERKEELPERKFTLEFGNPLDDFDKNTRAWYSANQFIGKGSDLLGVKAGLDENIFGRIGMFLFAGWWNCAGINYISHEIAHEYEGRRRGVYLPFNFDLSNWLPHLFPLYIQEGSGSSKDLNERIVDYQAGLYQQEFNASFAFKERIFKDKFVFDEGLAHIATKIEDFLYITCYAGFNDDFYKKELREKLTPDKISDWERWGGSEYYNDFRNDIDMYSLLMTFCKNIDYKNSDFLKYAVLTDFLTVATWDSIFGVLDYIKDGKREREITKLNLGDVSIIPPDLRLFSSPDGFYIDMELPIKFDDDKFLFFYAGTGVDSLGDKGEVDTVRLGGQFYGIKIGDKNFSLTLNPFLFINLNKKGRHKGYSVGTEAELSYKDFLQLYSRIEFNENDMIENKIKREKKGIEFRMGFSIKY